MKRFYTRYDYWLTLTGCLVAAGVPYYVLWRYGYETNLDPERVAMFVLAALGGMLAGLAVAVVYQLAAAAAKMAPALVALGTAAGVAAGTVAVVETADSDRAPNLVPHKADEAPILTPPDAEPEAHPSDTLKPPPAVPDSAPRPAPRPRKAKPSGNENPVFAEAQTDPVAKVEDAVDESLPSPLPTGAMPQGSAPDAGQEALKAPGVANGAKGDTRAGAEHVALGYLGYPIFIYFNRPETVEILEKNFVTYDSKPVNGELRFGENEKVLFIGDQKHVHVDLSFIKSRLDNDPDVVHYTTVPFDKWVVVKAVRKGVFDSSSGYADAEDSEAGKLEGYVLEYLVFKKNTATGEGTHLLKVYCPRVYKKLSNAKKWMDFRVIPK